MIDPLRAATQIAGSGLDAQSVRLRIVSENLARIWPRRLRLPRERIRATCAKTAERLMSPTRFAC